MAEPTDPEDLDVKQKGLWTQTELLEKIYATLNSMRHDIKNVGGEVKALREQVFRQFPH